MTKKPQKPEDVEDEPGAGERFMRGVRNIVKTPPKPFTPKNRAKQRDNDGKPTRS